MSRNEDPKTSNHPEIYEGRLEVKAEAREGQSALNRVSGRLAWGWSRLMEDEAPAPLLSVGMFDEIIRSLEAAHHERVHLEISLADRRVDWEHLGLDPHGDFSPSSPRQDRRPRWPLEDGGSLEGQVFAQRGMVRLWRYAKNPERDPLGHLVKDTRVPKGAAVGAVAGLLLSRGRAVAAAAGAVAGAAAGRWADQRPRAIWLLEDVRHDGRWRARRMATGRATVGAPA